MDHKALRAYSLKHFNFNTMVDCLQTNITLALAENGRFSLIIKKRKIKFSNSLKLINIKLDEMNVVCSKTIEEDKSCSYLFCCAMSFFLNPEWSSI